MIDSFALSTSILDWRKIIRIGSLLSTWYRTQTSSRALHKMRCLTSLFAKFFPEFNGSSWMVVVGCCGNFSCLSTTVTEGEALGVVTTTGSFWGSGLGVKA